MAQTATAVAAQFAIVGIDQVVESKTNPRKHFAKDALQDLTNSVREKGVLVPLLVRKVLGIAEDHFEIVAGARRYRAAKAAGVQEIPVLVRELDDEQALEVQVIENLQRADVHPLEEAEGYKQLLAKGKYEIETLADKVGKSTSYVYQRLKLAELDAPSKKAFLEDKITSGHAILIARLQPDQQKQALEYALDDYDKPSVRELSEWIQRDILLDLHSASFPKDKADLVAGVPACTDCPKRTGFAPALFPDVKKKDTCTDPTCFHKKAECFVMQSVAEAQVAGAPLVQLSANYSKPQAGALRADAWQEFEHKSAKCSSAEAAIVVEGRGLGKKLAICAEVRSSGDGSVDRYRSQQAAQEKKRRNELELRRRIMRAIAEKNVRPIAELKPKHWEILAGFVLDRMYHDAEVPFCNALGIPPKKASYGGKDFGGAIKDKLKDAPVPKLVRWLLLLAVSPDLGCATYSTSWSRGSLFRLAELEGVKVGDIEKRFKAELAAKKSAKGKKLQPSAKKKAA